MMMFETSLDLTIGLLLASNGHIKSIMKLDKMHFLLYRTGLFDYCYEEMLSEGKSYKYGPFHHTLLEEIQAMEDEGIVAFNDDGIKLTIPYRMTVPNIIYCRSRFDIGFIKIIADLCNNMRLGALLRYVYDLPHLN